MSKGLSAREVPRNHLPFLIHLQFHVLSHRTSCDKSQNLNQRPVEMSRAPSMDPSNPSNRYLGFDHMTLFVGNAKQAAAWYITRMGFEEIAYKGLETGSRYIAAHLVANNAVIFVFVSPLRFDSEGKGDVPEEDRQELYEIHEHLRIHGDGIKYVAFAVNDSIAVYEAALSRGAIIAKVSVLETMNTTHPRKDIRLYTKKQTRSTKASYLYGTLTFSPLYMSRAISLILYFSRSPQQSLTNMEQLCPRSSRLSARQRIR